MATLVPDKCPRCAVVVIETGPDEWVCDNTMSCGGWWPTARAWERECIARSISGNKKELTAEEYLGGNGASSLKGELEELVSLVSYLALSQVRDAVDTAVKGRKHVVDSSSGPLTPQQHKLIVEAEVLDSMRAWIEGQMEQYGETDEWDWS